MDYLYQLINLLKHWSSYFTAASRQNNEDLFYKLLLDKNYDEAIKLANQHKHLDIDLVYKFKWRNSGITVQSIDTYLGSIQDKLWAINECVRTVPISHEACRRLIKFGLREANLRLLYQLGNEAKDETKLGDRSKNFGKSLSRSHVSLNSTSKEQPLLPDDISDDEIEGLVDFDNLTDQQKELCRCRQDLMRSEHSLFAYESILGDYHNIPQQFDHVFYDEFRRKCPLEACLDYAHEGDPHAVEVMLNFYTDDLTPHLLAILSNLPETISPFQYRNLLPCRRDGDLIYEWRALSGKIKREEFDWSNRGVGTIFAASLKDYSEEFETEFYKDNEYLKKYLKPLTSEVLSQWFIERALEIESRTLLLSCAIQILHLGTELNIENLKGTHDDLVEFDRIVYECCAEKDIYTSFTDFNKMPEIERLVLITGDSVKNCKDRFRFYVIPYIHKREAKLGLKGKAELLADYFRRLAHTREHICRPVYNDLLDKIECDNFVAEWTNDLDDIIDEIGEEIKTIERNRQAKQLSTIASQTIALGDFNGCYEACQLIMKKNHKDCWPICSQLGMHKQFNNLEAKYNLLAFALANCDDPDGRLTSKMLDYVIELRKRDEKIQLAYLQLNM